MNRIDRVTAILIQLQSKRVVKAQEIADRFNISLRTVYRDLKTLDEAGIPLSGEAGIGYSIMEGYRLPPVMFTSEEATALLTAEKLIEKLTDSATMDVYRAAMFKIKAVLRLDERDHLELMGRHIEVIESPQYAKTKSDPSYLQQILKAIAKRHLLNIDYFSKHSQEKNNRNVEPVGIFLMGRYWYLVAWCCLRNDYRTFKVENIRYLSVTEIPFDKEHPMLQSFLNKMSCEKELHDVVIRVEKDVLQWLGEQKYYHGFLSLQQVGDQYELRFLTGSLEGFARWFMLYGERADIVTPTALKDIVRKNLAALGTRLG